MVGTPGNGLLVLPQALHPPTALPYCRFAGIFHILTRRNGTIPKNLVTFATSALNMHLKKYVNNFLDDDILNYSRGIYSK